MGATTKTTQKLSPPLSLRSQKGLPRQSPQSRLRSRSYSHDNELYRMGLRKNEAGEWDVVDNLPTAGIAAAMRAMRIKSLKREMSPEKRMDEVVDDLIEERRKRMEREKSADMEDSTAVYEEIQVYMEITGSRDLELVDVDGDTNMEEVEEVLQSVEPKAEVNGEVKMEPESDEHALETLPVIGDEEQMVANRGREPNFIINDALSYLDRIKIRFVHTPEVYEQFLEILKTYKRGSISIQELSAQVARLFSAAPLLLEGFARFFPENPAQAKTAAPVASIQTPHIANKSVQLHQCPHCDTLPYSRAGHLRRHMRMQHAVYPLASIAPKDG